MTMRLEVDLLFMAQVVVQPNVEYYRELIVASKKWLQSLSQKIVYVLDRC